MGEVLDLVDLSLVTGKSGLGLGWLSGWLSPSEHRCYGSNGADDRRDDDRPWFGHVEPLSLSV